MVGPLWNAVSCAISRPLPQLEAELGTRFFHRSRRGVEPTETGRIFLAHATAILRQVDDAKASVRNLEGAPSGTVVFGVPHCVSNALALPLLQAVRQRLPKVELVLTEELTGNLIPQLRTGQINLAVLFDDGTLDEFSSEHLLDEHLALCASKHIPHSAAASAGALAFILVLSTAMVPSYHHGGVKRLVAGSTTCVTRMKGAQVQAVYGITDEVRQVPLGQPFLQCSGQKVLLIGLVRYVADAHPQSTHHLNGRCW